MGKIERFEDFIAWQKARELTRVVYQITQTGGFARDFALSGQMRRAAISIMSNIAEGFERKGRSEFHQFLSTAKASCAELRSHFYIAIDAAYVDEATFHRTLAMAEEVGRVLGGLRASVERQRDAERHRM